jgi:CheY-like chemotaxis protein
MNMLILVVDDEPDVEVLFRQQFRRDLRAGRFTMEFAQSANMALQRITDAAVERDQNSVRTYDTGRAIRLLTLKSRRLYRRRARSGTAIFSYGLNRGPWWTRARLALSWIDHNHYGERRCHQHGANARRRACAGARQRHPSRRGWRQPGGESHAIRDGRGCSGAHANRPAGNDGRCCGSHAFTAR